MGAVRSMSALISFMHRSLIVGSVYSKFFQIPAATRNREKRRVGLLPLGIEL